MQKRIYLSIMGGIGDQIFQLSFANYLKKRINCEAYLDISYYDTKLNYNKFKFRLKNLAIKNNFKLTDNISKINYKYLSYLRIFNILKLDIIIPSIYQLFFKIKIKNFIYEYWKEKRSFKVDKNSYYFGYWHDLKYIKPLIKNIHKHLINPNNNKIKIKKFIKNKINNKTVCVHIRGGDFEKLSSHNLLDQRYYDAAINFYQKKLNNPNFHIFTNDIKFSKKILSKYNKDNKFKYIKGLDFSDIEEFCLFTKYKYSIIANSTFSLISTYLSSTRNISLAPKIWLKGKKLEKRKRFSKLKFI